MSTAAGVRLSVDLGTTWTAAALAIEDRVEPLALGVHGAAMPSVVTVVEGRVVAGNEAVRAGAADPAASAREFKRRLGDTAPIVLAGTPYGAETLTGHLLAHVVSVATAQSSAPEVVTLTHPAVFGEYKLDLLREAARVAGFGTVSLLSEPEAAALHYARLGRLAVGDTVAVYDFGGGTFDAAIVRLGTDGPQLLGRPEGLERLGGIDLDHAVLAHVDASLGGALSALDTSDPAVRRALLALRDQCVGAKESLSADTEVGVTVTVPGLDTVVRVTRSEFESFVRPRLAETLGALDRAIGSADLAAGDLAGVVLVGGSSRIPLVVEQVGAHTGRPLLLDADPKLVVALGAAPPSATSVALEEDAMSATPPTPRETDAAGPAPDPGAAAAGATAPPKEPAAGSGRRTTPGARAPEKGGMSTAGKVAAGVAAAGLAGATAAFWRDDVAEAVGLGDDDEGPGAVPVEGPDPAVAAAAQAVPQPVEESMDAFDAVAGAPGVGAATSGAAQARVSSGASGGAGGTRARAERAEPADLPVTERVNVPRPAPAPPAAGTTASGFDTVTGAPTSGSPAAPSPAPPPIGDATFDSARALLQQRLEAWTPPEGADATQVAELRDRLEGLLDRYEPRPGQSVDDAIAELRDEFDLRIDNFVQDEKIDALVEQLDARPDGDTMAPDPEFELRRDALRESLADWQAPEGMRAEEAAELKAQLQALVDTYEPRPGQTAAEAVASLRAEFDDQVQDFVQDQKIDALIEAQNADDAAEAAMPRDVLTDDFDELIADVAVPDDDLAGVAIGEMDPTASPIGDPPGFAIGEPPPGTNPFEQLDDPILPVVENLEPLLADDLFAIGDLAEPMAPVGDLAGAMAEPVVDMPPSLEIPELPDLDLDLDLDRDLDLDAGTSAIPDLDPRLTTTIGDLRPDAAEPMDDPMDLDGDMAAAVMPDLEDPLADL